MTIYSFYIFDRHTECIYQRRWVPPPASNSANNSTGGRIGPGGAGGPRRPQSANTVTTNGNLGPVAKARPNKHSDDAKLLFGVAVSLRNMTRKLGGDEDEFISYRTADYKVHYYETPTSIKFIMLTDTKTNNLRIVLHQIWANLYVEYVVKNPLSPVEHPGGRGVNNELFELGLERFMTQMFPPGN